MNFTKITTLVVLLLSLVGCSTLKGLGDSLAVIRTDNGSTSDNYLKSIRILSGKGPSEVMAELGSPAYEGIMHTKNGQKYKDFVLVYPMKRGAIGDKKETITRVNYNINKQKRCLYFTFKPQNKYRLNRRPVPRTFAGKDCSPYVDPGFGAPSRQFEEMTAKQFEKKSAHFN